LGFAHLNAVYQHATSPIKRNAKKDPQTHHSSR
jgi:hypothetical protein